MKANKPEIGVKPYYIVAEERIKELSEAIVRSYNDETMTGQIIVWAKEIICQCEILDTVKGYYCKRVLEAM